jgi:hypothetical protein
MSKQIKFKGEIVKYNNIVDLSKKLNITRDNAKQLVSGKNLTRYIIRDGIVGKYNIRDKPLLFQDFNIKRLHNKRLFGDSKIKIKGDKKPVNIFQSSIVPPDIEIDVIIKVDFKFIISPPDESKMKTQIFEVKVKADEINEVYIKGLLEDNFFGFIPMSQVNFTYFKYEIKAVKTQQKLNIINGKLQNLKLRLYSQEIDNNEKVDCVRDYLIEKYPKICKKSIQNISNDNNGVSINEIKNFCEKYEIKMSCYDINGLCISSYYPSKKSIYKNLYFIAYDNHLYGLNKSFKGFNLKCQCKNIIHIDDSKTEIINFLKKRLFTI